MIDTKNLTKKFGNKIAVSNLNLKIPEGIIYTLIGPNAAGKTTTIKLLTGLLKPTQGKIFINSFDLDKDYLKAKQDIGYIPDYPYLYEKLTGWEFVKFVANLYNMEWRNIYKQVEDLFNLFRIEDYKYNLIESYSHGMKKKLVFISALIHNPKILIIDEPMVGLDPYSAKLMKKILKQKAQDGVCIFMSTHNLSVAEEIADKIGVIDEGILIKEATFNQLLQDTGVKGKLEDVFLKLTHETYEK